GILDIALTSRQDNIPMCGLPYHASENYIARLLKAGYRVAICEQMEKFPSNGNIVKREVVRIVTPGTIVESNLLQTDDNNYLSSIVLNENEIGMAFVDISTGDFFLSTIQKSLDIFRGEVSKKRPKEVVLKMSDSLHDDIFAEYLQNRGIPFYKINEWYYDIDYSSEIIKDVFNLSSIKGLGIKADIEILAAGSILQYLKDTQKKTFDHLKYPRSFISSDHMILDDATISNLELIENQQDRSKKYTLFSVLNHTKTASGRRALERNLLQPLLQNSEIEKRLDIVEVFFEQSNLLSSIQEILKGIHDIERLLSRFILGKSFPKDFIALMNSLRSAAEIRSILSSSSNNLLYEIAERMPDLSSLSEKIDTMICENPALTPEHGRVIKDGYCSELDNLYKLKSDTKDWILRFQDQEQKRLGISTLKVKYNKVLGYFIEVSKGQTSKVPESYYRKQTLVGSERYTTEDLQKFESDIISASDKIINIERDEIDKLLIEILQQKSELQKTAVEIGDVDFFCSLAVSSIENRFIRPKFNNNGTSIIREGRHPVVEKYFTSEVFIPNDVDLDCSENIITILTGPNMSGKSTYIRMAAIIQLLAQIGSFVPASEVDLSIVDRIFTRIGAADNISRGESTFLVEMNETAVILNNATDKSLIIMDEIGRGTSTYDGLAIAWAVVEYILRYLKAKTLFATHYHELTKLGKRKGIVNFNVLVKEHISGVDFLHKVMPGAADKSYGIHVAKLAGIPKEITTNADRILERLENSSRSNALREKNYKKKEQDKTVEQLDIFNAANHIVIQAIKNIDINVISPLDAINELNRLKKLIE
ncbi:MAG: DNA mismatch repair protein MutS, partial [Spirochaetota bacterium]|nr:DNA mismatch repair protein MutS [Spirochaetota bacterium]